MGSCRGFFFNRLLIYWLFISYSFANMPIHCRLLDQQGQLTVSKTSSLGAKRITLYNSGEVTCFPSFSRK